MIRVTPSILLTEDEIEERFVRASGPGGQNVNKVATAVELRFDARHSPGLPEDVRHRLERLAGRRLTAEGVVIIQADSFRSQDANRRDALERLLALIRRAAERPRPRRPTRPTLASKRRRLEAKGRRSALKSGRGARPTADD